ncbi:MAG: hypothetical protein H7Y07_03265 [Pyrinomonadaceae bacterium]|nr:hypothetical protein [Sphingobacteriaceae bacterium]
MINLLKYRAALIGIMFGLFGGGLSKLLVIDEMSGYYTALSSLLALIISLLISFLLKGRWNRHVRNNIKIISIVLFAGFIYSIYLHTILFTEGTFRFKSFEGNTSYYVKGDVYTFVALAFKKNNPQIISDEDLVREGFESPDEKGKIWTPKSIRKSLIKLISSYSLVVISFVSIISILMEVLIGHYKHSTLKTQ